MNNKELTAEIEKLREEMQQKSCSSSLTAQEILCISEKLDSLINIYLLANINSNNNKKKTQKVNNSSSQE